MPVIRLVRRAAAPAAFVVAGTGLYLALVVGDCAGIATVPIKYALVVLCAAFACLCAVPPRRAALYLAAALTATVVADWFLLVTDEGYGIGVGAFAVAQLMHFARLCALRGVKPQLGLGLRAVLFAIAAGALAGLGQRDPLLYLTAFYFVVLLGNACDAFLLARRDRRHAATAAGFVLFIVCDVMVGLHNLGSYVADFADGGVSYGNLSWVFYGPSQILIALGGAFGQREGKHDPA